MTPDQPLSLAIAVFCSVLCWLLPLRTAIIPLMAVMCAYPTNIMVPPANLQLTVQRVVGLMLFLRCISSSEAREKYRWTIADTGAVIYLGLMTVSQLMTTEPVAAINSKAGLFLSALVPYWCVRFLVIDRPSLYAFMRGMLWISVPMVGEAIYQAYFGDSPYRMIMQYGLFWKEISGQWTEQRLFMGMTMFRAAAPFMQCIMFGWFFAIQIPWATNLFWERRSIKWWVIPWMLLPVGTIATVSAGPMMMAGLSFFVAALFPWRRFWRIGFGTIAAAYLAVTIVAKRGVMEIVASFGFDPASSYYRVNLLNFTLGNAPSWNKGYMNPMKGHWMAGYGIIPKVFDDYHDLCIQWIFLAVTNGLLGTAGFYIFVVACAWCVWNAKKRANTIADEWLCWSLMAILIGSMLAMQLVALFAEMFFLYHVFLALMANTVVICGTEQTERHVGVLAELGGRQVLLRYRLRPGQRLAIVRPGT